MHVLLTKRVSYHSRQVFTPPPRLQNPSITTPHRHVNVNDSSIYSFDLCQRYEISRSLPPIRALDVPLVPTSSKDSAIVSVDTFALPNVCIKSIKSPVEDYETNILSLFPRSNATGKLRFKVVNVDQCFLCHNIHKFTVHEMCSSTRRTNSYLVPVQTLRRHFSGYP